MGIKLINEGKISNTVMQKIVPPMVNRDEIADAIGYVENAGAPTSVVPHYIGEKLFDTSGLEFYIAYGVASGEWALMGMNTLALAELSFLDSAASTNAVASKAAIIDATGILALGNNKFATEAGTGITAGVGTVYKSSVEKIGGRIKSSILIDLTGLSSSTTDLDIIGAGAGPAHLGQITAARNGTILTGKMTCLEAPVGGVTDIDIYSADEATGVFDAAISTLVEVIALTGGAAWAIGDSRVFTGIPAANKYLYLTGGAAGTAAAYTAGKFLIEMEGYDA